MADFRSEREMRESAFQVKEMAERRQHELSGEVSTLQKQLTELQTVNHFDADVVRGGGGEVVRKLTFLVCFLSHRVMIQVQWEVGEEEEGDSGLEVEPFQHPV